MGKDSRLSARFGADTSDFKAGITAINRELKIIETGFRATASTMDDWSNNATGLEARMNALNKSIDLQKEKVESLRVRHEQMAEANGANSVEAQNAQIEFNKEAEKLGKLQTELGQTEYSLKGLKNESGKTKNAFKDMGKQFDALKQQVPQLGTAINLLTNPLTLAIAGIGAFGAISEKSITKLVAYNKTVREMMQLTGLSADEVSRIIQVADDWGIELETVRNALELMNKKGVTPSIDNLAKIADEFVSTTDKSAFAEEATKKYGKSFSDLIPLLVKGGDALRKQAASINDNMIATEKSMAVSREYEVAVDDFNDAVLGLEYTLGNELIPILVDVMQTLIGSYDAAKHAEDGIDDLDKAFINLNAGIEGMKEGGKIMQYLTLGLTGLLTGQAKGNTQAYLAGLRKEIWGLDKAVDAADKGERDFIVTTDALTGATDGTAEAVDNSTDYIKRYTQSLQALAQAKFDKELEKTKIAADKVDAAFGDLLASINGPVGKAIEDFTVLQGDLNAQMRNIKGDIDKAIAEGYDPLGEKVLGLKGDYDKLDYQVKLNAINHNIAMKGMIADMVIAKLAVDGFTDAERNFITKMLTDLGLADDATYQVLMGSTEIADYLNSSDMAGAAKVLSDLYGNVLGIEGEHNVDINVRVHGQIPDLGIDNTPGPPEPPGPPDIQHGPYWQHGANFKIPSGFNENYPLGFGSSGEQIIIIPPGERFGTSLATIQQLITQAILGLNSHAGTNVNMNGQYGGRQLQPAATPIQIIIQGVPDKEMDMHRLARYVATEIQRKQL